MIWVMRAQNNRGVHVVTLPKKWVKENIEFDERMLFFIEKKKGCLEMHTERSWADEKFGKSRNEQDTGAAKTRQRKNKPRVGSGAGEQHEEVRPVAADTPAAGK